MSSAIAGELFECGLQFSGIGTEIVKEKKMICTFRNMALVQTILRKIVPRNDDFLKI